MNNKSTQQRQAHELFFNTNMTQEQIANLLNVNRKTVGLWITNGKWKQMKEAALVAPGMVLNDLYHQLGCMINVILAREPAQRFPTLEESTIQRRLLLSIKMFSWQPSGNYMQIYSELMHTIARDDQKLAVTVADYCDDIVQRQFKREETYRTKQYMFSNDDVNELDNLDKENSPPDNQTPQENVLLGRRCPEGTEDVNSPSVPTPMSTNGSFGDISENNITQQNQPSPPIPPTQTSQNNLSTSCDISKNTEAQNNTSNSDSLPGSSVAQHINHGDTKQLGGS